MMSRHGLTGGARGLVYRGEPRQTIFLIYQGRRGSRCAWRRWEVMDGLVAVMRWLFSVRQSWWWRPARVLRGRCDENRRGVKSLPLDQPLPT